jgi:hypothetical protein
MICLAAIGLHLALRRQRLSIVAAVITGAIALSVYELPPGGGLPLQSDPPVVVAGVPAEDAPLWKWLRDEVPDDSTIQAFPAYPNESIERFHMYGQTVHALAITNGDAQSTGIGSDTTSSIADPRWAGAARALRTLGVDYVTIMPELYAELGVGQPDVHHPPAGFRVARVFPDGTAVWRVTAAPRDGLGIFQRDLWWTPTQRSGRSWRYMRDEGVVHLYVPVAGHYRLTFGARSAAAPRPMVVDLPDNQTLRATVGPEREVATAVGLPAGRSDIKIQNPGYAADHIPSGDPRAWSFEISDLSLTRLGG